MYGQLKKTAGLQLRLGVSGFRAAEPQPRHQIGAAGAVYHLARKPQGSIGISLYQISTYIYMYMYVHKYVCIYIYIHIMCIYIHVCICIHMPVPIHAMNVRIYIYIYI